MANGRKQPDWTRTFGNLLRTVIEAHPHWELDEALGADSSNGGSEVYYIHDVKGRRVVVWMEQMSGDFINIRSRSYDKTGELNTLNRQIKKLANEVKVKDRAWNTESSRVRELMEEVVRLNEIIDRMIKE